MLYRDVKDRDIKERLQKLNTIKLPDKERILKGCEGAAVLQNAAQEQNNKRIGLQVRKIKPVFAICVLVCIAVGASVYGIVVEAKEYNAAVAFFEEYNLSTEGLTRSDIKEIYRDITSKTFNDEKTLQVISKSIGGYEISIDELKPEQIEEAWNEYISEPLRIYESNEEGVYYITDNITEFEGEDVSDHTGVFEKYKDGESIWKICFDEKSITGYESYKGISIVYGETYTSSSKERAYAWLAMVDSEGNTVWEYTSYNDYEWEWIEQIIVEKDCITVFSRVKAEACNVSELDMLISKYNVKGERIECTVSRIGDYGILEAVQLGEGYLVQLGSYEEGQRILKVDSNGSISEYYEYSSENQSYVINHMIEYGDKIYLSGYVVPKMKNYYSVHGELSEDIWNVISAAAAESNEVNGGFFELNEVQLDMVRDNYTAVLLICEPNSGEAKAFYSVEGCMGAGLGLTEEGLLQWNVECLAKATYCPFVSSFLLQGASSVYEYKFDKSGSLISSEMTDELVRFAR